jgi:hypothetical protein
MGQRCDMSERDVGFEIKITGDLIGSDGFINLMG